MRKQILLLVSAMALMLASCGGGSVDAAGADSDSLGTGIGFTVGGRSSSTTTIAEGAQDDPGSESIGVEERITITIIDPDDRDGGD